MFQRGRLKLFGPTLLTLLAVSWVAVGAIGFAVFIGIPWLADRFFS